jgi:hypothetical protein
MFPWGDEMPITEKQLGSGKKMIRKCRMEESSDIPPWLHSASHQPRKCSSLGPSGHPEDEARKGLEKASQAV